MPDPARADTGDPAWVFSSIILHVGQSAPARLEESAMGNEAGARTSDV
jgi:hypothetical protein